MTLTTTKYIANNLTIKIDNNNINAYIFVFYDYNICTSFLLIKLYLLVFLAI